MRKAIFVCVSAAVALTLMPATAQPTKSAAFPLQKGIMVCHFCIVQIRKITEAPKYRWRAYAS